MRTYRYLVADEGSAEEEPREVLVSIPERDDLTHEMTGELLTALGGTIQQWYIDRHGFIDPRTRCGGPVGPGSSGPE